VKFLLTKSLQVLPVGTDYHRPEAAETMMIG